MGSCLSVDASTAALHFGDGAMDNLHTRFYRSKLTSWMALQEEHFRFVLLQGDPIRYADCTLTVR
jgi:hypothetical protein